MMKEVRNIEQLINKFQNELRQNVHKKQLEDYINIGYEIQNEFSDNWEKLFKNHESITTNDKNVLESGLKHINDIIYNKEANKIHSLKLKASHQIKLLHNQEKLVAINERVEEATNFRNELKYLVRNDENRLEKNKDDLIKNLKAKLSKDEKTEIKKLDDRILKEQHKLTIKRNKETDIINKQINLHISDIVRIQNSIGNLYLDKGAKADELQRIKERQRDTNKTIGAFKAVKIKSNIANTTNYKRDLAAALLNLPSKNLSLNSSMESTSMSKLNALKKNIIALKYILKTFKLTRFDINSEFDNRKFCNVKETYSIKDDNNLKKKIRKLLDQRNHKDEIIIDPTAYYDDNLNLVTKASSYRDLLPKLNQR